MSKMTIRVRLLLFISVLVLAVSLILGFTSVIMATNIVELNTEEWIMNEAAIGAELVSSYINNYFTLLHEVANLDAVKSMNREIQYEVLIPYIEILDVDDIMIMDVEGNAWHVKGGQIPNVAHRDYAQKVLSGQNALSDIILPVAAAVDSGFPVLLYCVPIRSSGRIIGALLVRTNALKLTNLIKTIKARGDNYSFIWSNQGTTQAHSSRVTAVGENIFEAAKENAALEPVIASAKIILSQEHGSVMYNFNNNTMLSGYSRLKGLDLTLVITANLNSVMTEVYFLRNIIIAIVLFAIVVGTLAALYISGFIAKRLKNVQTEVQRFSEGDFSHKIQVRAEDEIGAIGHCINLTSENVGRLVHTIKDRTSVLSGIVGDLSEEMVQTMDAVKQINDNMENINGRMSNQSASITETNYTMKKITDTIGQLSNNIENQSESVSQSSSAIEQMLANIQSVTQTLVKNNENVESLAGASDAGRSGLQEVAADIQDVSRESEGLLEINSVIENIASQTNLLSMNAAIEAAHAGEAGKGFAVVADEIRKLAESSSEQSKIISGVLKKIKEAIEKIIRSTETVLNKFEAIDSGVKIVSLQENSIRASMEEQSVGSKQILEAISRLNELTRQVRTNSAEMKEGSQQVIQESHALEKTTEEIAGAVNDMESGTTHINAAIVKVNETTAQNKENIDVLIKEVEKFKAV